MLLSGVLISALISLTCHSQSASGKQVPFTGISESEECCFAIQELLPGIVAWPGSASYINQQSSYYSAGQAELQPQCRLSPTTASDVSRILNFATEHKCRFAVRSGGHMAWRGASNSDNRGFTIDLQNLGPNVSLSEDRRIVSFSAGSRWRDVYKELTPHNLTTVGGRVGDVGVAGFLLGGGIGFLTSKHGFGSDNVINYEVVLADGTIVNANDEENSDLYWALKLGSTNFGIVTRFEMRTFSQGKAWGGSQFFALDDAPGLLERLVGFTKKSSDDPRGFFGLSLAWNAVQQSYIVWALQTYLEPVPYPPLWSDFVGVSPLIDTVGIKNLIDITEEFQEADPGKQGRSLWSSMSFVPDAQFHLDVHRKGVEVFEPYHGHPGVTWAVSVQPLPRYALTVASEAGGNPIIANPEEDLWIMLINTDWLDTKDDTAMTESSRELIQWAETEAVRRGLFRPFVYMNYAAGYQNVISRATGKNLERMLEVKKTYDPDDLLDELWLGGFKLPRQKREHDRSEL
ncbi:hypothetical protein PQX77_012402 [Marasmius sp. AFHP31]|nr:hypothetical protein PQX77_012402 [Marasmius sp. AFHP31]